MSASKDGNTKNSILGKHVLNFIKNYVQDHIKSTNQDENDPNDNEKKQEIEVIEQETVVTKSNEDETPQMEVDETIKTNIKSDFTINSNNSQKLLFKSENEFKMSDLKDDNYLRGCKWSPDGYCILTNSNDFTLRIFDVTNDLIKTQTDKQEPTEINSSLKLRESSGIYDFAWYPLMNSYNPDTACIFSTSKSNPVHLFDAYTGLVRCSYQGFNHLDELINAYSLGFNSSCTKLYCGYNKALKIFDISRPGRNYEDVNLSKYEYKLPGIVSSISFSQNGCYAIGSYARYIGVYIESNNGLICMLEGHKAGITHLMFSPDGNYLYSGARKDSDIYCWDMRNLGRILQIYKRIVNTNQRIYFDIDSQFKYVCSGNDDGTVHFWNGGGYKSSSEDEPILYSFKAHNDCVNGVSFHPTNPAVLATTSGQRKFFFDDDDTSSSSDDENTGKEAVKTNKSSGLRIRENSLKIWNLKN